MEKHKKGRTAQEEDILSYSPVFKYMVSFCIITMLIVAAGGIIISFQRMKKEAYAAHRSAEAQVANKLNESLTLLESLAVQPEFYDPDVPPLEKVEKLDRFAEKYGYLLICYVDTDINVYSIDAPPASLASREYMQQLFSTGTPQVTDSFAAGADGVTLNYTCLLYTADSLGD